MLDLLGVLGFATSVALSGILIYLQFGRRPKVTVHGLPPAAYTLDDRFDIFRLRMPIVLVNTGGKPGVFLDARLESSWSDSKLELTHYHNGLEIIDDERKFAHPLVLAPGASTVLFASFKLEETPSAETLCVGSHEFVLHIRTTGSSDWTTAGRFEIEIDQRALRGLMPDTHWNPVNRGPLGT